MPYHDINSSNGAGSNSFSPVLQVLQRTMADDTIGESSIAEPEDKIDPMASTASVSHRVEGRNESHAANTVVGDGTFAEQDYISTRRSFRSSAASRDNERCGSSGAASIFTAEEHGERSLSVEATVDDGSFSPSAGSQTGTPRGGSDGTNEAVHEEAILEVSCQGATARISRRIGQGIYTYITFYIDLCCVHDVGVVLQCV